MKNDLIQMNMIGKRMMKMTRRGYDFIPNFVFEKLKQKKLKETKTKQYTSTITWTTLGIWSMNHKNITFNLNAFGWAYRNKAGYGLYRKLISSISHEVIHGVVQKIMEQDKWSGFCFMEWPMKHGMDTNYERTYRKYCK